MNQPVLRQNWLHLSAGFLAMGSWALFANRAHSMQAMLLSGLVQGCLSAIITLVMKQLIEALVQRLTELSARILPALACFILSITLLTTVHSLAGTPELLATMIVPVTVATTYAAIYTQTYVSSRKNIP